MDRDGSSQGFDVAANVLEGLLGILELESDAEDQGNVVDDSERLKKIQSNNQF